MSRAASSERALFLAAVALLGLVVTPLLHAEEHLLEAHEADEDGGGAALALAWRAGSTDPLEALAAALEQGHDAQREAPGGPGHHHHSHGPAGTGPHGAGALAHLAVALHAAPQLPVVVPAQASPAAPRPFLEQRRGTVRYLMPEWSQAPPSGC